MLTKTRSTPAEVDRMEILYREGLSCRAIGLRVGRNLQTVQRYLRKRGVVVENRSRRRENSPNWSGGRRVNLDGYIELNLRSDDPFAMPNATGRTMEHRYVMAQHLGRHLLPAETVHHKNGEREDNRLENLELWVKRQPPGQRIEDRVGDAIEVLQLYAPQYLKAQHRHPQMRLEAA